MRTGLEKGQITSPQHTFEQEIKHLLSKSTSLSRVNIVFSDDPDMVMAINTYQEKLQNPDLIINRQAIKQQRNLTDPQIVYTLEHEMGHYDEEAKLRATPDGQIRYEQHLKSMEQWGTVIRNKLWHFENKMRDVWVNKRTERVIPVLSPETQRLYQDIYFKQNNYLKKPLHIQLEYAILREMMLPDELCMVDPRVRGVLNWLHRALPGGRRSDLLVDGTLAERYDFYEQEMRPKRMELYKIDLWEKKNEKNSEGGEKEGGEQEGGEKEGGEKEGGEQEGGEKEGGEQEGGEKEGGEQEGGEKEGGEQEGGEKEGGEKEGGDSKGTGTQSSGPTKQELDSLDPTSEPDHWEGEMHDQLPHLLDQLSPEQKQDLLDTIEEQVSHEQEEIIREMQEKADQEAKKNKEAKKSDRQKQLEHRVEQMGIDRKDKKFIPTVQQLQNYESYVAKLIDEVRDESGKKVFDQLINLFDTIKSENSKYRHNIRGPVDQEHGERLYGPTIASSIASVLGGETNPEMRAKDVKKEKLKQYRGNIEVDIFADGTGSMCGGNKIKDQKQAVILMLEALKKLEEKSRKSINPLITPFNIKTSMSIFGKRSRRVKELGSGVSDRERIAVFNALNEDDGLDNNEGVLLEQARYEFAEKPQHYRDGIKKGYPKKIIFILTDGGQDVYEYKEKLEQAIQNFRDAGVIVYGVAMGSYADDVDEIYGSQYSHQGGAVHCEATKHLGSALSRTMQPHLLKFTMLK